MYSLLFIFILYIYYIICGPRGAGGKPSVCGAGVSGSIPGTSRLSGCRPHLRPPGAEIGSRLAVAWRRKGEGALL